MLRHRKQAMAIRARMLRELHARPPEPVEEPENPPPEPESEVERQAAEP
jgi:hypothetical protein